jgi:hypothetical protein
MSIQPASPSNANSAIDAEEMRLQQALTQRQVKSERTGFLNEDERRRLPLAHNLAYGLSPDTSHFLKLPRGAADHPDASSKPKWNIELQGLKSSSGPLGIEMLGDVVLGIDRGDGTVIDLDLSPYGAEECGVSRKHAVIRPTRNRIYLIDLQSTNGTRINALPVGPGMAMEIHNGDTLSLGTFNFTVRILNSPK